MNILMIDNYDSFTYNLVHMLEAIDGVKIVVRRNDEIDFSLIDSFDGIVLSPGPGIPSEAGQMPELVQRFAQTKKILGVCLGHQCIGEVFGGTLANLGVPIHGKSRTVSVTEPTERLFEGLERHIEVGRYHSWVVSNEQFPAVLQVTAIDDDGQIMAMRHREFDVRGVQFHPESILTPNGKKMLENWVFDERVA